MKLRIINNDYIHALIYKSIAITYNSKLKSDLLKINQWALKEILVFFDIDVWVILIDTVWMSWPMIFFHIYDNSLYPLVFQ